MTAALVAVVTALADDELVIGHRHSEWTGFAPHLEEDVAFSSIAQDEIGHAAALYGLAARIGGGDPDALALGRPRDSYRHAPLCEAPNGDWAFTVARHWLYDHADDIRLAALERSSSPELAALAAKMRREERYHLMHADAWMERIARGPVEGRSRLMAALAAALPGAAALLEGIELEDEAVADGILPEPGEHLAAAFAGRTAAALDALGLPPRARPEPEAELVASSSGDLIAADATAGESAAPTSDLPGRAGPRSAHFERLWDVMTSQYRADPAASW